MNDQRVEDALVSLSDAIKAHQRLWFWDRWFNTTAYHVATVKLAQAFQKISPVVRNQYLSLEDWQEIYPRLKLAAQLLGIDYELCRVP